MRTTLTLTCGALLAACAPAPDTTGGNSDPIDETLLDRSVGEGPCGYPGEGPNGYGTEVGQRVANSAMGDISDCESNGFQLSDFMCRRDDAYGDFNRAVLINIGAGWCGPCQDETKEFPELYDEFHDRGVEFVQIMFQDWDAQLPTRSFCSDWKDGMWAVGEGGATVDIGIQLQFPVLLDQVNDWTSIYLQDPQAATPVNMLIDANGNIRWKTEGQKPEAAVLRAQFENVLGNPYAP